MRVCIVLVSCASRWIFKTASASQRERRTGPQTGGIGRKSGLRLGKRNGADLTSVVTAECAQRSEPADLDSPAARLAAAPRGERARPAWNDWLQGAKNDVHFELAPHDPFPRPAPALRRPRCSDSHLFQIAQLCLCQDKGFHRLTSSACFGGAPAFPRKCREKRRRRERNRSTSSRFPTAARVRREATRSKRDGQAVKKPVHLWTTGVTIVANTKKANGFVQSVKVGQKTFTQLRTKT